MAQDHITKFYGDGRANENPQDFLKSIEASFYNDRSITSEEKCKKLWLHCHAGFEAEDWYDKLEITDPTNTTDWPKLHAAFLVKWPKVAMIQKTADQKKAELFAETLEGDEMLEKEVRGSVPVYKYIAWADRVAQLASSLGDTQGLLVSVVREGLPKALRNVVGLSHTDWPAFTAAVRSTSPTAL